MTGRDPWFDAHYVEAAVQRVAGLLERVYGAAPSEETATQARRLTLAALNWPSVRPEMELLKEWLKELVRDRDCYDKSSGTYAIPIEAFDALVGIALAAEASNSHEIAESS